MVHGLSGLRPQAWSPAGKCFIQNEQMMNLQCVKKTREIYLFIYLFYKLRPDVEKTAPVTRLLLTEAWWEDCFSTASLYIDFSLNKLEVCIFFPPSCLIRNAGWSKIWLRGESVWGRTLSTEHQWIKAHMANGGGWGGGVKKKRKKP